VQRLLAAVVLSRAAAIWRVAFVQRVAAVVLLSLLARNQRGNSHHHHQTTPLL
jgi:hypothetical protein